MPAGLAVGVEMDVALFVDFVGSRLAVGDVDYSGPPVFETERCSELCAVLKIQPEMDPDSGGVDYFVRQTG